MKTIPLTNSRKVALVSDKDAPLVRQFRWRILQDGPRLFYAIFTYKGRHVRMHHLIKKGFNDHRDTNGLNNQRRNLRPCTRSQNMANSRKRISGSSRYKGVCFKKREGKWLAQIKVNRVGRFLGYFDNHRDAALAYNRAAKKHFGRFARLNILQAARKQL